MSRMFPRPIQTGRAIMPAPRPQMIAPARPSVGRPPAAARVGQDNGVTVVPGGTIVPITMDRTNPVCPVAMKLVGFSVTIAAGESETVEITTPGAFCPSQLVLDGPGTADVVITSITSGLENQIIGGGVDWKIFDSENSCCITSCLRCLCLPGVPLRITFENSGGEEVTLTGALFGTYRDACEPNVALQVVVPEGCPCYPEKLVGFVTSVPATGTSEVRITTPGRFCPRRLVLSTVAEGDLAGITITGILNGLENEIIAGSVPASIFTIDAECCPPFCLDCICLPGVELVIRFANSTIAPQVVIGALVGCYTDIC